MYLTIVWLCYIGVGFFLLAAFDLSLFLFYCSQSYYDWDVREVESIEARLMIGSSLYELNNVIVYG